MDIEVIPATEQDARHVATHLRAADFLELTLWQPEETPEQSVMDSVSASEWCDVVKVDGVPVLLAGLCDSGSPRIGVPWMVATDRIRFISRQFLNGCASRVQEMQDAFPILHNQVHRGNTLSINWLRWLGFVVVETPTGNGGEFFDFYKGDWHA